MGSTLDPTELEALANDVRRDFGDRFPVKARNETAEETQLREERTRLVLEREILPELAARRVHGD